MFFHTPCFLVLGPEALVFFDTMNNNVIESSRARSEYCAGYTVSGAHVTFKISTQGRNTAQGSKVMRLTGREARANKRRSEAERWQEVHCTAKVLNSTRL